MKEIFELTPHGNNMKILTKENITNHHNNMHPGKLKVMSLEMREKLGKRLGERSTFKVIRGQVVSVNKLGVRVGGVIYQSLFHGQASRTI